MPGYSPSGNGLSYPFAHTRQSPNILYNATNDVIPQGRIGFSFQKRNQRVDWRKLGAIDVEKVARDVDIGALQDNILNVAFCDISNEVDVRNIDTNFFKLFLLAQLMIEYLLHSQEYLQSYINENDSKVQDILQERENTKSELEKKNEAYRNLKKEYHKTKKLLGEYQLMIRAGASGAHKCPFCSKSFVTEEFLRKHIERRHADIGSPRELTSQPKVVSLPEQEKAQLLQEIQRVSTRLQMTETKFQTEAEERNALVLQEREAELKKIRELEREQMQWKEKEEHRMKIELDNYKDMIMQELRDVHAQKDAAEMALKDLQKRLGTKRSMIGDLEDVDGGPEKRMEIIKDDFKGEILSLKELYQKELHNLERKFKDREQKFKANYEEELEKSRTLLEQYQATLSSWKQSTGIGDRQQQEKFQNISQKLKDLERKIMEEQKQSTSALTLSQLDKTPPIPPPRTPPAPRSKVEDSESPGKDDVMSLWVASLNQQNFRVWRSSSTTRGDWKDVFSFCGCSRPSGRFDLPIFVYSAGGSPYWRQYVSGHSNPPRSHYKQDFVFYASSSELLGTFKINVLDSGSGSVIKSMLSRNSQAEGWKNKGLSFYVLRPKSGPVGKSVSFISTLEETESGDDVSVSSFTGTEEAKKNLAEVIKRSREDLIKAQEEELEDELDSEEDEEELDRDETDGEHLGQSSSTSLWGSTLFETGTYRPFKNNPLAIAQYNHSKETIEVCRNEAIESLEHILSNYGVDPDASRMSMRQFQAKMKNHDNRVKQLSLDKEGFIAKRRRVDEDVEDLVQENFGDKKNVKQDSNVLTPGSSKKKSKFKSALTAIKSVTRFSRPQEAPQAMNASQTMSSTGSYEEFSSHEFLGEGKSSAGGSRSPSLQRLQQTPLSRNQTNLSRAGEIKETLDDDDDISISDDGQWDSERASDEDYNPSPTAQLPRVTVTKPIVSSKTPQVKPRVPRGEKVRELTASLEASLNSRTKNKKLAGAVDLHGTDNTEIYSRPKTGGAAKASPLTDDFDDGSDFSLSSLEDGRTKPNANRDFSGNYDSDDAIEDVLRGVGDSGSGYRPSKSSTRKPAENSFKSKPQTAVSKISLVDDFDDDSDIELQRIP